MVKCISATSVAAITLALWSAASLAGDRPSFGAFWDSPDAYLGQARPGDRPKIFAPGLLADPGTIAMDRIAFSPDGKEIYYNQNSGWFDMTNAVVKAFTHDGRGWQGPKVVNRGFGTPTLSMDGNTLFLLAGTAARVWQSKRTPDGWSPPTVYLEDPAGLYDFMPTESGTAYVGSRPGPADVARGSTKVFATVTLSSGAVTIESLGIPLNQPGYNGDFFVARDESFMVLSARETKDFESELFISYRKPDGTWTNPKSLGPAINDGLAHRWGAFVTPDNKYLFYSRGTSPKDCALYWVRFGGLLEHLRHTNFEPYVKTPLADRRAAVGVPFLLEIDGTTFVDDDGGDTLSLSASLANGAPFPPWLRFDAATRTLVGTPRDAGSHRIRVTATDPAGAATASTFVLEVAR